MSFLPTLFTNNDKRLDVLATQDSDMYSRVVSSKRNLQTKSNDYQTNLRTQRAGTSRVCQSQKLLNKKTAKNASQPSLDLIMLRGKACKW